MHLIGFTIRIYYDARTYERQMEQCNLCLTVLLIGIFGWMLNILFIYTAVSAASCKLEC